MFIRSKFDEERENIIENLNNDFLLKELANEFVNKSNKAKYAYVWTWLGLPIIQMPEDLVKTQEMIYETQPDFIIETGVAWGGSLVFYASVLKSIGKGKVIGIDVTIPEHNRNAILSTPCADIVELYEGSSVDEMLRDEIMRLIPKNARVMLILDSHHTHEHVVAELELWSPLVSKGNYIIVCDTIVENIESPPDRVRPWSKGDNPMTATKVFLEKNSRFTNNSDFNKKTFTSFHPDGVLLAIN
jgi:cephalosporin hydroxylase